MTFNTSAALMLIILLLRFTSPVDKLQETKIVDFDIGQLQMIYLHSSDARNEMGIYWHNTSAIYRVQESL
jgi:hypothetical protein